MNMHEQAQRLWAAVNQRSGNSGHIDHGRAWVGTSPESVRQMRERQLVRIRHILADMGPDGLNELNDETIALVKHCIRARERQGWCPTGMYAERVDRELRSKQR